MTIEAASTCDQCGHSFDDHALFAFDALFAGGVMLCPVSGCQCESTWSVEGRRLPDLPTGPEIMQARIALQMLDTPPMFDHGADRANGVFIESPNGIDPEGGWWDALIATPCPDCNANLFAKFLHGPSKAHLAGSRHAWSITTAHDDGCPTLATK